MSPSDTWRTPILYTPIGVIHSDHIQPEETPIQPRYASGCPGHIRLLPEYAEGLRDVEGFTHLILIYAFHQAGEPTLIVQPFTDDHPRGIFATRHPRRPNPLGVSTVRLIRIEGTILYLEDVDILDGTPLLDIKPYVPRFEQIENARGGWTEAVTEAVAYERGRRGYRENKVSR